MADKKETKKPDSAHANKTTAKKKPLASVRVKRATGKVKVDSKLNIRNNKVVGGTDKSKKKMLDSAALDKKKVISDAVSLPTNVSVRSLEKVVVIERQLIKNFEEAAFRISYVAGVCMILVGLAYAGPQLLSELTGIKLAAQAISTNSTDSVDATANTTVADSVFQLTTSIPDEVKSPYPVTFSVTNAKTVAVKLVKVGETGFFDIASEKISGDHYKFLIPSDTLVPGYYIIRIYVVPLNSGYTRTFESKQFIIGPVGAILPDPVDTNVDTVKPKPADATDEDIIEISGQRPVVETPAGDETQKVFSIFTTKDASLSGTEIIGVTTPEEYKYIELHARPVQSLSARFVALATKRFERWQFVVNTNDIPNGEYEFFAKTKQGSTEIVTKPLLVTIKNAASAITKTETKVTDKSVPVTVPPDLSATPAEPAVEGNDERPFYNVDETDFVPTKTLEAGVEREVDSLLDRNSATFKDLLERYAVARQSGDELLIKTATDDLLAEKDRLVTMTLRDEKTRDISDNIDEALQLRLADLQNKVDTFEQIRTERSSGTSAVDSDGDGISDFDEINLYHSNPEAVDSDNDGVTDGVEIMRGFDPNDAGAEAVMNFESPKESIGLVRSDVLEIEDIVPVVKVEAEPGEPAVAAEIKGRALPNSFVTLYIFSIPTVVTIKTDADGSFVYTFDRELEDGEHDVYVAITDNTGDIIAQSNAFSFVKEAQAFTPVDAANAEVETVSAVSPTAPEDSYGTVAGIGILALGLILIMLGLSLRTKKSELSTEDSASSAPVEPETKLIPTYNTNKKKTKLGTEPTMTHDI